MLVASVTYVAHRSAAQPPAPDRTQASDSPPASAPPAAAPPFDPAPLLANLRPADRRAAANLAPRPLDALTFHDLQVTFPSGDASRATVVQEIRLLNVWDDALTAFPLRVYANAVGRRPPLRLTSGRCEGVTCRVVGDGRSVIWVRPVVPVAPGAALRVRLSFEATLRDVGQPTLMSQALTSMQRLNAPGDTGGGSAGHGDYGLVARGQGIRSLGNFYAVLAERRGEDWVTDDASTLGDLGSGEVAHFRLRVTVPAGTAVAVSGEVVATVQEGDLETHEAVGGLMRNVGVVVGDLAVAERQVRDVSVRSWFLEAHRPAGEAVLEAAAESLRIFERRFGPYPYTDLDVVEAPLVGGAGGVEFSGLVTCASMFYAPSQGGTDGLGGLLGGGALGGALGGGTLGSSGALGGAGGADPMASMQSAMLEFVTAHEVAHQWWHGLVGSDARAHPWVDESLAQFSAVQYVRERHGPARAREEAERQVAANYHMMRLSGGADGAVDRPVAAFGGELAYAGLVYGKGPFFYERARARMGNGPFFRALRGYVGANRFRTAGPTDLRDRLARGRPPIARLARRWLDEAHGDADLGRPSPARLLQGFLGPGVDLPPELDGLLQGLGGMLGSDTAGSRGGTGSGGTGSGADLQQALRALQGL